MKQVARNIKADMAFLNLSGKDMARACKVSDRTWRRWLEDPSMITLAYLSIIAKKLGVEPADLLGGTK